MDHIAVMMNSFARDRHQPGTGFSFFDGEEAELVRLTSLWFAMGLMTPGYKDGVVLVNVPADQVDRFVSGVCKLTENTPIVPIYAPRRDGEEPRKSIRAAHTVEPLKAKSCQVVLYRNDVLAENDDNESDPALGECWEIVSVNASPLEGDLPIPVNALIYNHLGMSGGTRTNMSDEAFVEALRHSMEFWKNHAMQAPSPIPVYGDEQGLRLVA